MPRQFNFSLDISPQLTEQLYRGSARYIKVQSEAGLTLQLPAMSLRPFISISGIKGRFRVSIDDCNKLVDLQRVSG